MQVAGTTPPRSLLLPHHWQVAVHLSARKIGRHGPHFRVSCFFCWVRWFSVKICNIANLWLGVSRDHGQQYKFWPLVRSKDKHFQRNQSARCQTIHIARSTVDFPSLKNDNLVSISLYSMSLANDSMVQEEASFKLVSGRYVFNFLKGIQFLGKAQPSPSNCRCVWTDFRFEIDR